MIPTAVLAGLVVGRWWIVPAVAIGWSLLLLGGGTLELSGVPLAAGLAALNAAAGVAPRWAFRAFRQTKEPMVAKNPTTRP